MAETSISLLVKTTNFECLESIPTDHVFTWTFRTPVCVDENDPLVVTLIIGETEDDCEEGECSCDLYEESQVTGCIEFDRGTQTLSFRPNFQKHEEFRDRQATLTLHGERLSSVSGMPFQSSHQKRFYFHKKSGAW